MRVNQPGTKPTQGTEVSGSKQSGRSTATQNTKNTERTSASNTESTSVAGARTEISQKGKELAMAKSLAASAPDVREDRVADLKRRIAEGSYKIDADAIADRMVDEHLKMSGNG
jgi:negative regulator of flagellin synthesis FlgM